MDLNSFYRSKEWEGFIHLLKLERVQEDGTLLCEHCGKPIVKKYDCIGHHVHELNEHNVQDVMVALNPDNVILVHFKCHNEIHARFGYDGTRHVYLVYGSPCSGKTSWVIDNAGENDLLVDMDNIWEMVCTADRYIKPNRLKSNVFMVRDNLLDQIKTRHGKWQNAFVIGGYPLFMERRRLCDALGAESILIDTPKDTCLLRCDTRPKEYTE